MTKFMKGQSGNPAGRPKGIPDKRTQMRELFEPHAEALIDKAVQLALAGDTTALRMCLERIIPPMKASAEIEAMMHQEYTFHWKTEEEKKAEELTDDEIERIMAHLNKTI